MIYEAYTLGLAKTNKQGEIPLHIAGESCFLSILNLMNKEYPEGQRVMNKHGDLPLHSALRKAFPEVEVIPLLSNKNAAAFQQATTEGLLPIHLALTYST